MMRNSFSWNNADNNQRYHQTLLMATKKGNMIDVQNLLENANRYCSNQKACDYHKLKSIYINQLMETRESNRHLPMLDNLFKFEDQLNDRIEDIFYTMPPLEKVDESEEISDFVNLDEDSGEEKKKKKLSLRPGVEESESESSVIELDPNFLPPNMIEGITKAEFYDPITTLLLSKHLTENHIEMTAHDDQNQIWVVISKKDGGFCWSRPADDSIDEDSSETDDSMPSLIKDDNVYSSDDSDSPVKDDATTSDDSSSSSYESYDSTEYETDSESETEPETKNLPLNKVVLNIDPDELVQTQSITDANRQKWIEYVTKNCDHLDSFMKVIDYGFAVSWVTSKYQPNKVNFVSDFIDKAIEFDLVDVLMALNYNWPIAVLITAIESGSFRTATYLTRLHKKNHNKAIKELVEREDFDLIRKYLSNVFIGDLESKMYEELLKHSELHQVMIDQNFESIKYDIIEYLNENGNFGELKKFVNRYC